MGSAVLVTLVGYRIVFKRSKPVFAESFSIPTKITIDTRLILGAGLFGLGWGLYGYCPGPAIAALVYQSPTTLLFVLTMLFGMWLSGWVSGQFK